jgi:PAB-dependent poly(A)-specific ribonuclease subunit 2
MNTCTKCSATASTKDTVLLCDLLYPDTRERCSFARVVSNSMCSEQLTPAWCDQCRKYQPTTQSRRVTSLPYVVSLNAGLDNPGDVAFWQAQMERLHSEHCTKDTVTAEVVVAAAAAETPQQPQPPANVKQCRYGTTCSRPDCKFWHPGTQSCEYNSSKDEVDIGDKLMAANVSWVPHQICLRRHASGKVSSDEDLELEDDPIMEKLTYRL